MDMSIRFPNIGLDLSYVPKSIHLFGAEITLNGMLIALGMLLGIAYVVLEAKRKNKNPNHYLGMIITGLITAFVGARLFYVAFSWNLYKMNIMEIFRTRSGGMAFYGGLFGGLLGAALFCKIRKLPFAEMADTASIGIVIGQIIGRWGSFFNRESFGEYTTGKLAMQLPLSSVRAGEVTSLMRENLVTIDGVSFIQVSPVFLYESAACLLLLLVLLAWKRRKRFHGEIMMQYLVWYGLIRFGTEWLRTDKILLPGTQIGVSQIISAVLFLGVGLVAFVKRSMAKKRAILQKRRRERIYEEEERAQAEADRKEEEARRAKEAAQRAEEEAKRAREEADRIREAARQARGFGGSFANTTDSLEHPKDAKEEPQEQKMQGADVESADEPQDRPVD